MFFHSDIQYSSLSLQSSHTSACNHIHRIDWSKVSPDNIHVYRSMVCSKLLEFPADAFLCFDSHCSVHSDQLDFYADHVVSVMLLLVFPPVSPPLKTLFVGKIVLVS